MFSKLKTFIAGIIAAVGFGTLLFLKGRSSGKESIQKEVEKQHLKDVEDVASKRVDNVKVADDVRQEAIISDDKVIDKALNDKWTRG